MRGKGEGKKGRRREVGVGWVKNGIIGVGRIVCGSQVGRIGDIDEL